MFRIDVASAAVALPTPAAPGTGGYFTNGNPATSTASTVVDQDWLNSVQEELVNIATAVGASLSKTTRNQCLTAIQALIAVGASSSAIQAQVPNYQTAGGTANAITATFSPAIGAHITGAPLRVKLTATNTGATTFNPGPGAIAVKTAGGAALAGGELISGDIVEFKYDGTFYQATPVPVSAAQHRNDTPSYILDTSGAANTITLTLVPAAIAYVTGMRVSFKLANTVTGAANINVNALGNKAVKINGADPLTSAMLVNRIYEARYDGTNFQVLNPSNDYFESAEQTITVSTDTPVAHGLPGVPRDFQAFLRCKTAEFGFAIGDEYRIVPNQDTGVHGIATYANATNVGFVVSQNNVIIYKRSAVIGDVANLTTANWRVVLRAKMF